MTDPLNSLFELLMARVRALEARVDELEARLDASDEEWCSGVLEVDEPGMDGIVAALDEDDPDGWLGGTDGDE